MIPEIYPLPTINIGCNPPNQCQKQRAFPTVSNKKNSVKLCQTETGSYFAAGKNTEHDTAFTHCKVVLILLKERKFTTNAENSRRNKRVIPISTELGGSLLLVSPSLFAFFLKEAESKVRREKCQGDFKKTRFSKRCQNL